VLAGLHVLVAHQLWDLGFGIWISIGRLHASVIVSVVANGGDSVAYIRRMGLILYDYRHRGS
jgi:hypothetical protein